MKKRTIGMKCYDGYNLDHWDLLAHNNSVVYCNGSTWETTYAGTCTVVAKVNKYESKIRDGNIQKDWRFYIVQFEDGHYNLARISQMRRGTVKNLYQPKVHNIGYLGQGPYSAYDIKDTKEYKVWARMFERSYSTRYHKVQPSYKDCSVDSRWHNFQNFCEDIQELEGYAEWKANTVPRAYDLDKDNIHLNNKIYGREHCSFLKKMDNINESNKRTEKCRLSGKTYIGTRLSDGYTEEFINKNAFKKKYNMKHAKIVKVAEGSWNQTHGWTFKIKENKSEHNKKNI